MVHYYDYNNQQHHSMHESKEQSEEEPQEQAQKESVAGMLPPANPIMLKFIDKIDEKVNFKLDPAQQADLSSSLRPQNSPAKMKEALIFQQNKKKQALCARKQMDKMTLTNGYEPSTKLFSKHYNQLLNRRGKIEYFASLFIPFDRKRVPKLPQYKGMHFDDQLIFDSNYDSANLMAVFKIDSNTYDLVLQNDINTKGFTQWYNFKVRNKKVNFIAKFNIVNLYKTKSLYNMGMKPIVRSQRSDKSSKRIWRRRGFNIYYQKNQLNYEDNEKKFYKTLTFEYDFTSENDVVQFAHCIPYDLNDLKKLIETIKDHPKVSISSIGTTIMGRSIPMIKISTASTEIKYDKKALIILGRQHPGETPGSFVGQQMILELLKNSTEVDFLTWRYDIYIFPMVNIDGVVLGNYRGNFAGFDLNRSWLKSDPFRHPEVYLIKNTIKKIAKKQQIQLIIDLHGHSRKMGSFFYGNDYGSNYMLFPYIASRLNRNILFQKSKFTHESETDAKFNTARVVLGNLIKQSGGYVYTYEVSFYGYYKQNTNIPFSFNEEHYKQLGKSLVTSIYRTYLEIYKEQKTLKQSAYLKNIKGEISQLKLQQTDKKGKEQNDSQSGSDSEAEQAMVEEVSAIEQFMEETKYMTEQFDIASQQKKMSNTKPFKERQINQLSTSVIAINALNEATPSNAKQFKEFGLPVQRYNQEIKKKIQQLLDKNMQNDFKKVIAQRLPKLYNRQHLKSQKTTEDLPHPMLLNNSTLIQRSPQLAYLDYLKLRQKQRQCETNLEIHGSPFELQGRKKEVYLQQSNYEQELREDISKTNLSEQERRGERITEKNKSAKSYHTIQNREYSLLNRQEKQLVDIKYYLPRRKISSNHYIIKQESSISAIPSHSLEGLHKNSFHVQRLEVKTPFSFNQQLKQIGSSLPLKHPGRIKLPSI